MFLLIDIRTWRKRPDTAYFNTSHVSINRLDGITFRFTRNYFNTSHVSINLLSTTWSKHQKRISIHLMFLLIEKDDLFCDKRQPISIHLMFLLIKNPVQRILSAPKHFNTSHVSINRYCYCCYYCCLWISIHLMFLLIGRFTVRSSNIRCKFQYISCFY